MIVRHTTCRYRRTKDPLMQALRCPGFYRHCDREDKILTLTGPRNRLLLFGVLEDYVCQSRFIRKRLNRGEHATQKS